MQLVRRLRSMMNAASDGSRAWASSLTTSGVVILTVIIVVSVNYRSSTSLSRWLITVIIPSIAIIINQLLVCTKKKQSSVCVVSMRNFS